MYVFLVHAGSQTWVAVLLIIELFFQSPCMNMYALSSYDILNPVLTTVN